MTFSRVDGNNGNIGSANSNAFAQPQKLISRAVRARVEADQIADDFMAERPFEIVCEKEPLTGHSVQKIIIKRPLPDAVEERLTDAINNTRNAFDQALFAACKEIGKPLRDAHYPWSANAADLEQRLLNKRTGKVTIPREFWDVIRSQKPYFPSEPDDFKALMIRKMAQFANRKHTVGCAIGCDVSDYYSSLIGDRIKRILIPAEIYAVDNEIELVRVVGDIKSSRDYEILFYVGFDRSAPESLRSTPASFAVMTFTESAQIVLDQLKTRVTDIQRQARM